jgi:hypothetical protein
LPPDHRAGSILAVATAVGSASAVKAATTMEAAAATAVESTAATSEASTIAASSITVETAPTISVAAPITISATIVAMAVEAAPVVAVIPRSGAYKDSAYKVIRAVITVRGASIRIVAVITVGACRSGADASVHRADSNADAEAHLGLCLTCGKKQNCKKRCIF